MFICNIGYLKNANIVNTCRKEKKISLKLLIAVASVEGVREEVHERLEVHFHVSLN